MGRFSRKDEHPGPIISIAALAAEIRGVPDSELGPEAYAPADRRFAVVDTGRSWNRVQGRYETAEQARRRARDLNKRRPA